MFIQLHRSMNQELLEKYIGNQSSHNKKIRWCCAPQLSSETEVSISLLCQACSTFYTAVQIKRCLKSTSVIKVANMKIYRRFLLREGSNHVQPPIQRCSQSAKMNRTQRRTLVRPWRMHCTYCSMPKGTSRAEATLNSEKVKPVALAIIELH